MIIDNTNVWNSPVRSFAARVELYLGSALADAYTAYYALKSFSIERVGEEGKFFGFGICQKMNLKLIDKDRHINITTAHSLKSFLTTGDELITPFPTFYVERTNRDENTNALSVTAYDALYKATEHTVSELELSSYTIREFAAACATFLGCNGMIIEERADEKYIDMNYPNGANFNGSESIRDALNGVAEATQTIYYIDYDNCLVFKRLDRYGSPVITIGRDEYFTLESGENRRLSKIYHVTELGNNLSEELAVAGTAQYVRNNPFWEAVQNEDETVLAQMLKDALDDIGGLTINQFECQWRGNYSLEIGDKLALITKDNEEVTSYLLNDTLTYDGSLSQKTSWSYSESEGETESNSTSLGEKLNQTYARVDKINQEIELVRYETDVNSDILTALKINTEGISASVKTIEEQTSDAIDSLNNDINTLATEVSAKISKDDVTIAIEQELAGGVDKVVTSTGYTFNSEGLTISKTQSEVTTQINHDGMKIYKENDEVLTVDNQGVKAQNLHATTYLKIGNNSRFEDYEGSDGKKRTACFWIGM